MQPWPRQSWTDSSRWLCARIAVGVGLAVGVDVRNDRRGVAGRLCVRLLASATRAFPTRVGFAESPAWRARSIAAFGAATRRSRSDGDARRRLANRCPSASAGTRSCWKAGAKRIVSSAASAPNRHELGRGPAASDLLPVRIVGARPAGPDAAIRSRARRPARTGTVGERASAMPDRAMNADSPPTAGGRTARLRRRPAAAGR